MNVILGLCALYVFYIILLVLQDILKTVWHQFKGTQYDWIVIKQLKEKREWWKWILCIFAIGAGVYYLMPNSIGGKADFRANRELPEYTAYYECEYDIEKYGSGSGYLLISREDGVYCAINLFTDDGKISLDLYLEDDDLEESRAWGRIEKGYYVEIDIGDGPFERNAITLNNNAIFLAPNPVECDICWTYFDGDYGYESDTGRILCPLCVGEELNIFLDGEVMRCHNCEELFWPSDSDGFGLCHDCCQEYISGCRKCGEYTYRWHADDFSLCPKCAGEILSDSYLSGAVKAWLGG